MHQFDRYDEILSILTQSGYASVRHLAQALHVSEPTMRRDLKSMEASGLLRRAHGGAALPERSAYTPLALRTEIDTEQKKQIARQAVPMIADGMTVFFDASSTSRYIPDYLHDGQKFTAVCNSPEICSRLTRLHIPTYCVGGLINGLDDAIRGLHAEEFLRSMYFDIAFFSCTALSDDGVLSGKTEEGVSFLRTLLAQADQSVFLCTSSRFHNRCRHTLCDLTAVSAVLCDQPLPDALQAMVGQHAKKPAR